MITGAQRSKIFALARELNMSTQSPNKDDDLHILLREQVDKPSITLLTSDEVNKIIAELEHRKRFVPDASASCQEKLGGVSSGQKGKIMALMCELRKLDEIPNKATVEQRVAGIIRYYLHISATDKDPYKWLNYSHGITLIEIIKGMLETSQRQAVTRSSVG